MKTWTIVTTLLLSLSSFALDWDEDSDLTEADLQALELEIADEADVEGVAYDTDYEKLSEKVEDQEEIASLQDEDQTISDEVGTKLAKPVERTEEEVEIKAKEESGKEAVSGSAPLYN